MGFSGNSPVGPGLSIGFESRLGGYCPFMATVRYRLTNRWAGQEVVRLLVEHGFVACYAYRYGPGHHVSVELDDTDLEIAEDAAEIEQVVRIIEPTAQSLQGSLGTVQWAPVCRPTG